ncbi:poly-beta-1,6-N-acetyl-D-glucosamine biosynthesis protein PgaD [Pseudomonas sp. M30-35]|uniref:poly-beta-1,6-N-acetyl-D-glucosamine biosynthesis protein PgaD n=1 Tax=Pseudomonas sp. M30-35 TaxID=1981174 RepID=UPI000B3C56BC|nr:poly-beta-1,6-N-acetyl-D-glucosamine biosynthesis protein PgaD [Pseudomonas sp. M30-35]ARU86933.1 poly-beta-1,6-N-acetyl-D-glucosamine biosynthesis protein PgaD [Pseudomonas sp. M30-35]
MSIIKTEQHWLPKTIDTLLTLSAWAVFLYLITNGTVPFAKQLIAHPEQFQSILISAFMPLIMQLSNYAIAGALIGGILLTWAKYNELRAARYTRRERSPDLCDSALSASFFVTLEDLNILRRKQVLILHNTEQGDLSWIEDPMMLQPKVRSLKSGARLSLV